MKYIRINMEKPRKELTKELTNTVLEIAKRLGIEVNKDFIEVNDLYEVENYDWIKDKDTYFKVAYKVNGDFDNCFFFCIKRKHIQYNFEEDIMYGFFEYTSSSVTVNGSQRNKEHLDIVANCVEIHNKINYKKKEIIFEAKTLDGETIEFELEDLFGEGNRCDRVFYIGGEPCDMDSIKFIKEEE